jgi:hypothetical protein
MKDVILIRLMYLVSMAVPLLYVNHLRSLSATLRTITCLYHGVGNIIFWCALLSDTLIATRKMGVFVAFAILV